MINVKYIYNKIDLYFSYFAPYIGGEIAQGGGGKKSADLSRYPLRKEAILN